MDSVVDHFVYRKPAGQQAAYIEQVRAACKDLARILEALPMDPRCRALAITKLEEVSMWSNKGLAFAPPEAIEPPWKSGEEDETPERAQARMRENVLAMMDHAGVDEIDLGDIHVTRRHLEDQQKRG